MQSLQTLRLHAMFLNASCDVCVCIQSRCPMCVPKPGSQWRYTGKKLAHAGAAPQDRSEITLDSPADSGSPPWWRSVKHTADTADSWSPSTPPTPPEWRTGPTPATQATRRRSRSRSPSTPLGKRKKALSQLVESLSEKRLQTACDALGL